MSWSFKRKQKTKNEKKKIWIIVKILSVGLSVVKILHRKIVVLSKLWLWWAQENGDEWSKKNRQYCSFWWISTCLLDGRPKTAKPGDYGICIVANVWSPGVRTNLEHHDHEALSHERTTTLMRFGSVVAKSADLSRTLETIAMPLGMQLKDPFVHKRGRFQESEMPARDVMLLLLYSKL